MNVELLVVADCPQEGLAGARLREALDDIGLVSTGFSTRVIADHAEATQAGFLGSPTILLDGVDPFAEPGAQPALACRLFGSTRGTSPVPELAALRQALKEAADRGRC